MRHLWADLCIGVEQIFRPCYEGGGMEVRPRRWWSRSDRRAAATAAAICAAEEMELNQKLRMAIREGMH